MAGLDASRVAALDPAEPPKLDDELVEAIATRVLDRVAERAVAMMKEQGLLPAPASDTHLQLTLAEAQGSDESAVDALRDALDASEIDRPPGNAIVWDVTP